MEGWVCFSGRSVEVARAFQTVGVIRADKPCGAEDSVKGLSLGWLRQPGFLQPKAGLHHLGGGQSKGCSCSAVGVQWTPFIRVPGTAVTDGW